MLDIQDIHDPHDERVSVFRDIRERDLVRRGGFIAEGTVVVDSLLRSPFFRASAILVLRNRLAGVTDLLAGRADGVPILVADADVIDAIAGFSMHRGVLAHGIGTVRDPEPLASRLARLAAENALVVVAVGIANHDNIGAIFRNAAAFGASMVLLDEQSCDPLYRKAIRVSAGAVLHVPFERVDPAGLLPMLRAVGFRSLALSPGGTAGVETLDRGGPTALFLGSEGRGLPDALISAMESLRIDMVPGFDSLNVATAAAIALQRAYSARVVPRVP